MAKSTAEAEKRNAGTARTPEALEQIQNQLDNGSGQVETGKDISVEREIEDRERLGVF